MPIDFSLFILELILIGIVALRALIELVFPSISERFGSKLNFLGLALVGGGLAASLGRSGVTFGGMFASDSFSIFFKCLFLLTAISVSVMHPNASGKGTEFHLILWSALLGMFCLVSAKDFLLFFISLELLTLSLYILAAYSQNNLLSIEAGLKYLILGSLASAFLLYGISLVYAATGTVSFDKLGNWVRVGQTQGLPLLFFSGVLFILSALGFKVAAVPFQIWVPDVYQGAPTPVVAFLSVASKSAGFAALPRIFFEILGPLEDERRILFSMLAVLTLLYGNLGALVQKDIKRLLGYSSIGHAGFLLMGLAANPSWGGKAILYYLMAYAVSNLTVFFIVSIIENEEKSNSLDVYKGLSTRSPFLAAAMFLALLSLAGVPPLAGFFSKIFILLSVSKTGLFWIVFLGSVSVAISLYYYLNVIRILYFEKPAHATAPVVSPLSQLVLYALIAGILSMGVWQAPFMHLASYAAIHF